MIGEGPVLQGLLMGGVFESLPRLFDYLEPKDQLNLTFVFLTVALVLGGLAAHRLRRARAEIDFRRATKKRARAAMSRPGPNNRRVGG